MESVSGEWVLSQIGCRTGTPFVKPSADNSQESLFDISANGKYFAVAGSDSAIVGLMSDLRKSPLDNKSNAATGQEIKISDVKQLCFLSNASQLALIAGSTVSVYDAKSVELAAEFTFKESIKSLKPLNQSVGFGLLLDNGDLLKIDQDSTTKLNENVSAFCVTRDDEIVDDSKVSKKKETVLSLEALPVANTFIVVFQNEKNDEEYVVKLITLEDGGRNIVEVDGPISTIPEAPFSFFFKSYTSSMDPKNKFVGLGACSQSDNLLLITDSSIITPLKDSHILPGTEDYEEVSVRGVAVDYFNKDVVNAPIDGVTSDSGYPVLYVLSNLGMLLVFRMISKGNAKPDVPSVREGLIKHIEGLEIETKNEVKEAVKEEGKEEHNLDESKEATSEIKRELEESNSNENIGDKSANDSTSTPDNKETKQETKDTKEEEHPEVETQHKDESKRTETEVASEIGGDKKNPLADKPNEAAKSSKEDSTQANEETTPEIKSESPKKIGLATSKWSQNSTNTDKTSLFASLGDKKPEEKKENKSPFGESKGLFTSQNKSAFGLKSDSSSPFGLNNSTDNKSPFGSSLKTESPFQKLSFGDKKDETKPNKSPFGQLSNSSPDSTFSSKKSLADRIGGLSVENEESQEEESVEDSDEISEEESGEEETGEEETGEEVTEEEETEEEEISVEIEDASHDATENSVSETWVSDEHVTGEETNEELNEFDGDAAEESEEGADKEEDSKYVDEEASEIVGDDSQPVDTQEQVADKDTNASSSDLLKSTPEPLAASEPTEEDMLEILTKAIDGNPDYKELKDKIDSIINSRVKETIDNIAEDNVNKEILLKKEESLRAEHEAQKKAEEELKLKQEYDSKICSVKWPSNIEPQTVTDYVNYITSESPVLPENPFDLDFAVTNRYLAVVDGLVNAKITEYEDAGILKLDNERNAQVSDATKLDDLLSPLVAESKTHSDVANKQLQQLNDIHAELDTLHNSVVSISTEVNRIESSLSDEAYELRPIPVETLSVKEELDTKYNNILHQIRTAENKLMIEYLAYSKMSGFNYTDLLTAAMSITKRLKDVRKMIDHTTEVEAGLSTPSIVDISRAADEGSNTKTEIITKIKPRPLGSLGVKFKIN